VVGGFGVRRTKVGENLCEYKGAKRFAVRGYENWEKGIKQSIPVVSLRILPAICEVNLLDGVDHILIPQHNKASDNLLPQLWFETSMVLAQNTNEAVREPLRQVWIAVCNVGYEVDVFPKRDDVVVVRRGILEKYLVQCVVLLILTFKVGLVGA
jgi:hypothetical protein